MTGTDKKPLMFTGKSKTPWCFKKKSTEACGFYYQNNKTAWMTGALFEECVSNLFLAAHLTCPTGG